MSSLNYLVVFALDDQRFALYLSAVERVVRAVEITVLPKAPNVVLGVINVQGRIIPVLNIRQRFRRPEREIEPSDQIIIAITGKRMVAFAADTVNDVVAYEEKELVYTESIVPGLEYVDGVMKLSDGLVLIHDLDRFFSFDEEKALDDAMIASSEGK